MMSFLDHRAWEKSPRPPKHFYPAIAFGHSSDSPAYFGSLFSPRQAKSPDPVLNKSWIEADCRPLLPRRNPIQREGNQIVAIQAQRYQQFHSSLTNTLKEQPLTFRRAWGPMQSMLESKLLEHQSTRNTHFDKQKKNDREDVLPRIGSIVSSIVDGEEIARTARWPGVRQVVGKSKIRGMRKAEYEERVKHSCRACLN